MPSNREEGKTDLVLFILSKQPKTVHDLINTTWLMKTAQDSLNRAKKSRTDLLLGCMAGMRERNPEDQQHRQSKVPTGGCRFTNDGARETS